VVQVLVGRDAWQSGAITDVLRRNRIEVLDVAPSSAPAESLSATLSAGDKATERGQSEAKGNVDLARQQSPAEAIELMVVSAPVAQVTATLEDFQRQDQIHVVQVTDASAPERLYEQSLRALGVDRNPRNFAFGGANSLSPSQPVPADPASKKDLNEAAGVQPEDTAANEAGASAVVKDVQTTTAPVADQSAQKQTTEGDRARYGRGGTARFAEKAQTLRSGGVGGYGGGGYGAADSFRGTVSPPIATSAPLGFGQRVMLEPPSNYSPIPLGGLAGQSPAPTANAETFAVKPPAATSLGREQVLFLFHVVDTPLPAAVDRSNTTTPAGALPAGKPLSAKGEETKATPAPSGSSSK
jgi:hypothetical protein